MQSRQRKTTNKERMKKVLLTIALASFAFAANAQWVVGGNVNFSTNGGNVEIVNGSNTNEGRYDRHTTLSIMPKVGYQLNEKMQVGAQFGFTMNRNKNYSGQWYNSKNYYNATTNTSIDIAPYFRYNVMQWEKLSLFCEAQMTFSFGLKTGHHDFYPTLTRDIDTTYRNDSDMSSFNFTLSVVPGLNYKINEHCSMDLYVDLLGLQYTLNRQATGTYTDALNVEHETTQVRHSFNLVANANPQTLNNHLSAFRVGFNYTF